MKVLPLPVTISIHALREEGDQGNTAALSVTTIFLSTPSARRATCRLVHLFRVVSISIHALREEGDALEDPACNSVVLFLSTPSARRATGLHSSGLLTLSQFLSTPSARRATCSHRRRFGTKKFLSTPSARRATIAFAPVENIFDISIHALREEGDRQGC